VGERRSSRDHEDRGEVLVDVDRELDAAALDEVVEDRDGLLDDGGDVDARATRAGDTRGYTRSNAARAAANTSLTGTPCVAAAAAHASYSGAALRTRSPSEATLTGIVP
jgi:hypothetical protein